MNSEPKTTETTTDSQPTLSSLLIRLWRHLTKRRQRQLGLLLVLMLASAFSEVISLGAVLPFIAILTAPEKVFKNEFVKSICESFGITSAGELVLPLTIIFVCAALLAGATRLLMFWVSTRLSNSIGANLSIEIYKRSLYQPYKVHVTRNSSEIINGIASKSWVTVSVLQSLMNAVSSLLLSSALIFTLIAIDPLVILVSMIVFGCCYGGITWAARRRLQLNSQVIAKESTQVVKALQEGLGGIRDVLLNGSQPVYCDIYQRADLPYRRASASNSFIVVSPRFAMEAVGMVLIGVLAYGLSLQASGISSALPVLGALVLGAQRILPMLQLAYSSWASIAGSQNSLGDTLNLLDQPLPSDVTLPEPDPLDFKHSISFESLRFRYLSDGPWVLDGVSFHILKGSRVGFVGITGCGKTTLLDLLMGLLDPTEGQILVDDFPTTGDRRRSWQRAIAHVPQSIFLADITIAENIAFGVPRKEIDMERVRQAAQQAQIAKFIESRRQGYNELVGERGIRLSGGQRQRIGIARALYKHASVLVFDEATSSLDNKTEKAVMESIENLNQDLTILIIAHRLTTVQRCDEIIELEHGRVVAQGTYEQLQECSPSFLRMARIIA